MRRGSGNVVHKALRFAPNPSFTKQSGHMSQPGNYVPRTPPSQNNPVTCHNRGTTCQALRPAPLLHKTIRSHVTTHMVTCHNIMDHHCTPLHTIAHHRTPSHPTRELRAKHCAPNPSSFGHMQTHSFLFYFLQHSI